MAIVKIAGGGSQLISTSGKQDIPQAFAGAGRIKQLTKAIAQIILTVKRKIKQKVHSKNG